MPAAVVPLLETLRAASSFEEAGLAVLRLILNLLTQGLAESRYANQGHMLRGLIHLRTQDAYRQVLVVSRPTLHDDWTIEREPAAVSAPTNWHILTEQRSAVSLDLHRGEDARPRDHRPGLASLLGIGGGIDEGTRAHAEDGRVATHFFSAPLRVPGGAVDGMICIEAHCPAALGEVFIWDRYTDRVQRYCDLGAPYLLNLPGAPNHSIAPSKYLPVIGPSMVEMVQILRVFALQEETLLIGGPTGVGKSRLARWCHEQSPRRRGPFEALDLSSVPETLQLAELFGWKKGAFTDATQDTLGAVGRAEGGTLFIDEVDKLSLKAQAGLLHLLEERRYRPLGDRGKEREANVRYVIGTNANLQTSVREGRFREDLYFRINVLPVKVPPLSERRDELIPWARYMLKRRHGLTSGSASLAPEAETILRGQQWPGNLRQLDNIIRRAYALRTLEPQADDGSLTIGPQHVEKALQWEIWPGQSRQASELLMEAADLFVLSAQRGPRDLDLAEGFRGFILAAAIQRLGDREAAFRLLGKDQLVKNRNHQKVLKREIERAHKLCSALGEQANLGIDPTAVEETSPVTGEG